MSVSLGAQQFKQKYLLRKSIKVCDKSISPLSSVPLDKHLFREGKGKRMKMKKKKRMRAWLFLLMLQLIWIIPWTVFPPYEQQDAEQEEVYQLPAELMNTELPVIRWKMESVEVEAEPTVEPVEMESVEQSTLESMGEFLLTAYCPCTECSGSWGYQTSTGVTATEGRTVAVDPKVIPYGTVLVINGNEYVAEDCGSMVIGNHIDIFMESHSKAENFKETTEIFIKRGN